MKLSKLKKMLEDQVITQEEFDEMKATAEDDTKKPENDPEDDPEDKKKDEDDLDARIQKAVDRATNKLGNDNKRLKEELEKERKKNLSADELKKLEISEKEKELADKESELTRQTNRMYAITAMKKAELDDGSEDALAFVELVMADDEDTIDLKVKALQQFAKRLTKNTTDKIYKDNGRDPGKGSSGSAKNNPWSKDNWNLTEQMTIEINDPERAKMLKASAGK